MPRDHPLATVHHPACRAAAESGGWPLDRQSVGMSDFWHKMGCCVVAKAPPKKKRRRKIDRSMIGDPTNFIHLTHIGSGEMAEGLQPRGRNLSVSSSLCCDASMHLWTWLLFLFHLHAENIPMEVNLCHRILKEKGD
uniref:CRIB domain-containing protein n=1 Tax=Gasterosteus aculeatus aculeatus TaxID=481459 RepID=A0AAQ4P6V0_GASAC